MHNFHYEHMVNTNGFFYVCIYRKTQSFEGFLTKITWQMAASQKKCQYCDLADHIMDLRTFLGIMAELSGLLSLQ